MSERDDPHDDDTHDDDPHDDDTPDDDNGLIIHGRVLTADPAQPWAEAVVIRGAHLEFVGSLAEARQCAGDAREIDAEHGVVLPGFVDAHAHLLNTGASLRRAQLREAKSLDDIDASLRSWASAHPSAPRVLGIGWLFSAVPAGEPTCQMLDAIVDDRPVYLDANDLHSVWVNTAALAELGITDDTPDPVGGRIVRDATGAATGLLLENAGYHLAWPVMNVADDAEHDRQLQAALHAYRCAGTTSAVDMGLERSGLAALMRAEQRGELAFTVVGHWLIARTGRPAGELAQVAHAAALAARQGSSRVRIAGIKLIVDGTIDGCTAGMLAPYANGEPGELIWDRAALEPVVLAADEAGLQIAMHAIGDLAVRTAIDVLEVAAQRRAARGDTTERRHRIEHLEYVDEADVARLAPLGITASMQPVHCDPAIMANWVAMLGDERAARGFAWPEYLAHGTTLALGTDTPTAPYEPLPNMFIAATRKSPGDPTLTPHRPDFALPLADAIGHATRDAAWASHLEGERGMLRAGLAADLVILDRDPLADGPNSLLQARVLRTIIGGRTVHLSSTTAS